jgi:cytoskeletal protein RodZ
MLNEPIGEVLAQSRTNLGKSIKEVEFDTKIRAKHIEALEADDFDTLPGSIYTQGFIKTYANYLGIDPEPLIKSYRNRYLQPSDGDLLNVSSNIRVETKKRPVWLPYAIVAGLAAVLFIGLIAWGGYAKKMSQPKVVVQTIKGKQTLETAVAGVTTSTGAKDGTGANGSDAKNKDNSDSSTTSTTDENKDNKSTDTTETDNNKDAENKDDAKKDGKTSVTVKLTGIDGDGSWVKVYIDGEPEFVGVIDSGESKLFEGDTDVRVRIGNETGMEVMLNGKKVSTKKLDVSKGVIDHTFKDNDGSNQGDSKEN